MQEIWPTPQMVHAIFIHFPVALGVLGVPLVFCCAFLMVERNTLRGVALAWYLSMAGLSFLAMITGEALVEHIPAGTSADALETLERHEEMAELVWAFALGTAVLLGLSLMKVRGLRVLLILLALLASLATGTWVGLVGHYGGTLVYVYGVGTPDAHREPIEEPEAAPEEVDASAPASTGEPAEIDWNEAEEVSYIRDIRPIFERSCVTCHGSENPRHDLDLSQVATMKKSGREAGAGVVPGNPEASAVLRFIRGELTPRMPLGLPPLTEEEERLIRLWIAAGAEDDSPGAAPASE